MGTRSASCTSVTSLAPLRSVRMTVVPPLGCAPRIACGSWVSPATTLFMARWSAASGEVVRPIIGSPVGGSADEPGDGPQRDSQPSRPVSGFIRGLVDRLVQLVRRQQCPVLARIGAGRVRVPVTERGLVALHPLVRAGGQVLVGVLVHEQLVGRVLV